jgi:hydrogenase nickel incorporation protein HypA/HybF
VDHEVLKFAFMAITMGTTMESVGLEIRSFSRKNRCLNCGDEFESPLYAAPCPSCRSEKIALAGGEELDLAYIEVEEA